MTAVDWLYVLIFILMSVIVCECVCVCVCVRCSIQRVIYWRKNSKKL